MTIHGVAKKKIKTGEIFILTVLIFSELRINFPRNHRIFPLLTLSES